MVSGNSAGRRRPCRVFGSRAVNSNLKIIINFGRVITTAHRRIKRKIVPRPKSDGKLNAIGENDTRLSRGQKFTNVVY